MADPGRIAVAGRCHGAFPSATRLVHSRRFATAIAMSGAYDCTLGGADENPSTPPLPARRFLHALVGEGVPIR